MAEPQNGRIGGGVLKDNLLRQGVNLNFKNTSGSTALLHLDVNNAKIGINTESTTDALTVPTLISSTNLISTYANIGPNFTIDQSRIVALGGDGFINFNAANNIFATAIATDDLKIDFNTISTTTADTNIELRPNGNGIVNINSNWDIVGNLHATGNIQTTGDLTLGSNDEDNVTFVSDVNSDLIPDQTDTYDLGSPSKQWLSIYSESLNSELVSTNQFNLSGVSLGRKQGNIFYVSTLGNDTNVGDHPQGAYRTLKHALTQVDGSTGGPTAIHVFPGVYEEEFPLTVPSHVDIVGEDIRNVVIKPTVATQNNSAFYLEDDVTIENLTIKDFYAGYAFQFTAGGLVNTRSPYIRNVTVITKGSAAAQFTPTGATYAPASGVLEVTIGTHNFNVGDALLIAASGITFRCASDGNASLNPYPRITDPAYRKSLVITDTTSTTVTVNVGISSNTSVHTFESALTNAISVYSASDPRGFNQGDAGKGALIDGAVLDSASLEASMLFHSCTFITPGVDAITMTNGVRVEWLNSFTYFANRGLYATQGVTGKVMPDTSTRFGAELRSIGSACVYGNFGAVADGANTLMYLIGHNFAYIGTGKDVSNDNTLSISSQQTTELNSGTIVHTSTDQTGKFSVGDNFFVDFETGQTSIDANEVDFSGISAININNGVNQTYIDGERVDTGNIRFAVNSVETLTGPLNIDAANNNINFLKSTNVNGNIDMSGNFSIAGELINVGNEITDTVAFNTEFIRDVIPDISGRYNLGSTNKIWSKSWISQAQIADITIQDNFITTTESNADLELRANGTGNIYVPSNNVQIDNNLTVAGAATLTNTNITGTLTLTGNFNQTGNYILTEDLTVGQNLTVGAAAQFEEILIDDNIITTTSSNADLQLSASGSGNIIAPSNDVVIENDLTVIDLNANNINIQNNITSNELSASNNILVRDNFIETRNINSDFTFSASGTGKIATTSPVSISLNINVDNNMSFIGNLSGDDILSVTNLSAASTFNAEIFDISNQIVIQDNFITTTESNSDLDLRANGTGSTIINNVFANTNTIGTTLEDLQFSIAGNLNITSNASLQIPRGTTAQRTVAEDTFLDGGVALNSSSILDGGNATTVFGASNTIYNSGGSILTTSGTIGDIRFNTSDSVFEGSSAGIVTFGGVYSNNRRTSLVAHPINNTINITANNIAHTVINSTGIETTAVQVDDVFINNNIISPTLDIDLVVDSSITNQVDIDYLSIISNNINNLSAGSSNIIFKQTDFGKLKFAGTKGVVFPFGTTAQQPEDSTPPQVGDTRWNTDTVVLETWDGDTYITAAGTAEAISEEDFETLLFEYTLALG